MVIDKNGIVKRDEIDKKCSICEFFKQIKYKPLGFSPKGLIFSKQLNYLNLAIRNI